MRKSVWIILAIVLVVIAVIVWWAVSSTKLRTSTKLYKGIKGYGKEVAAMKEALNALKRNPYGIVDCDSTPQRSNICNALANSGDLEGNDFDETMEIVLFGLTGQKSASLDDLKQRFGAV